MKVTVITVLALWAAFALSAATPVAETEAAKPSATVARPLELKIIHTNDHHSYLDGTTYELKLAGKPTRVQLGGFARLSSVIREERNANSLVLNSGELNGTLYFSLFKGEPDFKVFNLLGLDAYALGNHEFDEGDERLAQLAEMANFPLVSSNVRPTAASPLYRVKDKIKPYVIKEIDGQKVGVIGILKVEKTKNSSMVSNDVDFFDEIETAKKMVAELESQGVDKIVLLSHVGYYNDVLFAKNVGGIDVIVGGDTHNLLDGQGRLTGIGLGELTYGQTGPFPGYSHDGVEAEKIGSYPTTVRSPRGEPVHIVTAWEYAYGVGILNVSFDSEGVATKAEGGIVLPVEGPYLRKDTAGAWSPVVESEMAELMAFIAASPILRERAVDAGVEAVIKPYRDEVERMKVAPIGSVAITMPFERIPAAFSAGSKPTGSYAAFVVAKAFREANPRIDVAIQNSGGVRTQFLEGVFTVGDAIKALPFANTVVMLDLTGEEIVKVLNQAAHYALNSGSTGAFPYSAGLRFDVDLKGAEGKVVFNVDVQDRASGVWAPIDLKATYTVSTNSFTALGKDNYLEFSVVRGADPAKFEDTYINYSVPLKEYVEKLPGKVLPALDPDEYCLKSVR